MNDEGTSIIEFTYPSSSKNTSGYIHDVQSMLQVLTYKKSVTNRRGKKTIIKR